MISTKKMISTKEMMSLLDATLVLFKQMLWYLMDAEIPFGRKRTEANKCYCRWMLDVTMDAEGAFERRRTELAESREGTAEDVTDEEV